MNETRGFVFRVHWFRVSAAISAIVVRLINDCLPSFTWTSRQELKIC